MTNKEFQNILANYPDEYIICMDNAFGWEMMPDMIDPHLYINTDIGQIEIMPDKFRDIWVNPKDRLPEDCETVLVRPKGYKLKRNELVVYRKAENFFHYYDACDNTIKCLDIDEVLAWMPIPEPDEETIKEND